MKITLSIEESACLIELGVDAKLASLKEFVDIHPEVLKGNAEYAKPWGWFPKFSLSDLLSILPKKIRIHRDGDNLSMIYHCSQWRVGYTNCAEYCNHTKVAPELIDALYQLLIWAIDHNYVKTEKK